MGRRVALIDALSSYQRVGLDTPFFVYYIEESNRWSAVVDPVIEAIDGGELTGVTSVITLMEVAIKPLKLRRPDIARAYEALIVDAPNLSIVNVDTSVVRRAAELRSRYNLRTPDAIQIASCLVGKADVFVTNDRRLRRVEEIDILLLKDFT